MRNICAIAILCGICSICASKLDSDYLVELGSTDIVKLLCNGKLTAQQYAKALLDRADKIECINAYSELQKERVLERAREIDKQKEDGNDTGPLCGLAMVVKDNIDVEGYITAAGTPALKNHRPFKSAALIKKFERAGGIVLGKATMHELAEGFTTTSSFFGPTLNPYKVDHHVGGSSGGTAALIAARGVSAGFCTDTSGSCRNPASVTGVLGYRPTTMAGNRHPCYRVGSGLVPMTTTRDTVGLMARSVEDIQFLDKVLSDCPNTEQNLDLEGLNIGYPREWWQDLGREVRPTFAAALDALKNAGVNLIEFDVSLMLAEYRNNAPENFSYIYEMPRELSRYLNYHKLDLTLHQLIDQMASPLAKDSLAEWTFREVDTWPTPQDYIHMLATVTPKITQLWTDYFDNFRFDVIIAPTSPITARPINASEPFTEINGRLEPILEVFSRTAELDCPSEVPGLSIPIGLAENGLPIGLQLHTRPGDDGLMLSVGKAFQAVLPKTPKPPELPACHGQVAKVTIKDNWTKDALPEVLDGESAEQAAERLSVYKLQFLSDEMSGKQNEVREEL